MNPIPTKARTRRTKKKPTKDSKPSWNKVRKRIEPAGKESVHRSTGSLTGKRKTSHPESLKKISPHPTLSRNLSKNPSFSKAYPKTISVFWSMQWQLKIFLLVILSSRKNKKARLSMWSALDNTSAPRPLIARKSISKPIMKEKVSVNSQWCTMHLELPPSNAPRKAFSMDSIDSLSKILLRKLQTEEGKNSDKFCQKFPFYPKSTHTKENSSVTFWKKRSSAVETT